MPISQFNQRREKKTYRLLVSLKLKSHISFIVIVLQLENENNQSLARTNQKLIICMYILTFLPFHIRFSIPIGKVEAIMRLQIIWM